jgi:hypothetical protein
VKIKVSLDVTPYLLVIRYRHDLWASRKVVTVSSSVKSAITSQHGVFHAIFILRNRMLVFVLTDKWFHLLSGFEVAIFKCQHSAPDFIFPPRIKWIWPAGGCSLAYGQLAVQSWGGTVPCLLGAVWRHRLSTRVHHVVKSAVQLWNFTWHFLSPCFCETSGLVRKNAESDS